MFKTKSSQTVSDVLKTNDLFIFKSINGNRTVNPMHVKRLSDSIKQHGMLCNPIIVNQNYEVIDGQHRLEAARQADSSVYYIVVDGYDLNEVQTLNLNQKNWTKKDYMDGYAKMGIESYVKLKKFYQKNRDFAFTSCIKLCSNISSDTATISQKYRSNGKTYNKAEVFEEGTWKGKDFDLAQKWADNIRLLKEYYEDYNNSRLVICFIGLFRNEDFDFNEFMQKLRLQPNALVKCASADQYKALVEDIYNYRRRDKISLKY